MSHIVTPDKLAQIVRPFVGAKVNRQRDPNCPFNGMLPRASVVDVLHIMNTVDADIRGVNAAGIDMCDHDGFALFLTWAEVRSITVRGIEDEETVGKAVYENAAAMYPLHSAGRIAA